jgi:hypothetical protein
VKSIWKGGLSLPQVFEVRGLDEDTLLAFTALLADQSGGGSVAKDQVLCELRACPGVQMAARFLFSDESVGLRDAEHWKSKFLLAAS